MADIGDGDIQAEAVCRRLDTDGVIKVFCRGPVNGHMGQTAQVPALAGNTGQRPQVGSLGLDLVREISLQIELDHGHGQLDLH